MYHTTEVNVQPPLYKSVIIGDNSTSVIIGDFDPLDKITWKGDDLEECLKHAKEKVDHPLHYTKHPSGIECIEIIRHMNFNLGNAIKYIWRADLKNDAIEDLKKAAWYIQDEIERREKLNSTP